MALKPVLDDKERFPAIDDLGFLKRMAEHESAPKFNFKSGDRLDHEKLERVKAYHQELSCVRPWFTNYNGAGCLPTPPSWLEKHFEHCRKNVPAYLGLSRLMDNIPSVSRQDLRKVPWNYVSDAADLDDLLVYSTSGTTGPPLDVMFDAVTQGYYLPQLIEVLKKFGVRLKGSSERVAIALICSQKDTLTYASLSSYLNNSGILKINLNKDQWKFIGDRKRFLKEFNPLVLTGDPFAFERLMELNADITPVALVSSAATLLPGLKKELENHFLCPVIDIYSLTECRMIAFKYNNVHRLIRHDLWVEIFDPEKDIPLSPGQRGELVISCGTNPFLNLVRYRTGDYCSMEWDGEEYVLKDFDGRSPVVFFTHSRNIVNSVDISRALADLSIPGYRIVQKKDLSLEATIYKGDSSGEKVRNILSRIFGPETRIVISHKKEIPSNKVISYEGCLMEQIG